MSIEQELSRIADAIEHLALAIERKSNDVVTISGGDIPVDPMVPGAPEYNPPAVPAKKRGKRVSDIVPSPTAPEPTPAPAAPVAPEPTIPACPIKTGVELRDMIRDKMQTLSDDEAADIVAFVKEKICQKLSVGPKFQVIDIPPAKIPEAYQIFQTYKTFPETVDGAPALE